uniref:Uncharacterized protein n=1 Tax=Rhizophora mucronata TaxID=61149 RepID=A0A2P2PR91_RHIMU
MAKAGLLDKRGQTILLLHKREQDSKQIIIILGIKNKKEKNRSTQTARWIQVAVIWNHRM